MTRSSGAAGPIHQKIPRMAPGAKRSLRDSFNGLRRKTPALALVGVVLLWMGMAWGESGSGLKAQGSRLGGSARQAVKGAVPLAMCDVAAGTFIMGRRDDGDDLYYGYSRPNEAPRHPVTLSAYQIGKYPVTNGQFCAVLNWALGRGYLKDLDGSPYTGGDVCAYGKRIISIGTTDQTGADRLYFEKSVVDFKEGAFGWQQREGAGGVMSSMENHPAICISWYGAVAFCNWLDEMAGLTPCYDFATWDLIDANPSKSGVQFANGYRLPTKAEWIRAASVEGDTQWIYGIRQDTLEYPADAARANFRHMVGETAVPVNPLGLTSEPLTSPVGWFNGINISPHGPDGRRLQTIDSPSPVGAYDLCGNVREWVHDWVRGPSDQDWLESYPETNPTGPAGTWTFKLTHGGSFNTPKEYTRVYCTDGDLPNDTYFHNGFRVARSVAPTRVGQWTDYQ